LWLIIIASLITTLYAISSTSEVSGQSLDATYANTQCGISIQYPSNWKSGEDNDDDPTLINFIVEIQPDTADGYKSPVSIELDDISGLSNRTLAAVRSFEEETLTKQGDINRIITTEPAQIAGYPAQKIVYAEGSEGISDNEGFKKMKVVLVAFDREYVIRYHASSPEYYDNYISTFEHMLNTFRISEPKFDGIKC
jgi:PsbP-like protein